MRSKRILQFLIFSGVTFFSFSSSPLYGEAIPGNAEILKELKELRMIIQSQNERIAELEQRVSEHHEKIDTYDNLMSKESLQDVSTKLKQHLKRLKTVGGLNIGAGITTVVQGTPNANNAANTDGEDSRFDGSYTIDLEIQKEFGEYGMAYVSMEAGQGSSVDDEMNLFSNVNSDADDTASSVDITQAWYEHYLFDHQIVITGGKLDATNYIDANEYANDETTQFLGGIFVNNNVVDFPDDNGLGARIYISPKWLHESMHFETVFMDENADYENLIDNPFVAAQFNFVPCKLFGCDPEKWNGNYRIYYWYNGAPHTKVKDVNSVERGNMGVGLSWDQMITDAYGVFGRFGWANPEKSTLEFGWSLGGQMTGKYWKRPDDILAVAIGQSIPGKQYGNAGNANDNETHIETYYAIKVNDHLTISPDVQLIWNPNGVGNGGQGDNDTMFVYGARGQVDF